MRKIILALGFALCAVPAAAGTGLFVGDSHSVGPFGWRLDGLLRKAGRKTATYASCGSIEQWWVTGKPTPCPPKRTNPGLQARVRSNTKDTPTPEAVSLLRQMAPDHSWFSLAFTIAIRFCNVERTPVVRLP